MIDRGDGEGFWIRVDATREPNKTFREFALAHNLNYEVLSVQRSLKRMPNAYDVVMVSRALQVPAEWLVVGKVSNRLDEIRIGNTETNKRLNSIFTAIVSAPENLLSQISTLLNGLFAIPSG